MTQQELELPKGWAETEIKSISELIRGVTYKKEKAQKVKNDNFIPILRANNFDVNFFLDDLVYLPKDLIKPEQMICQNDIIISMSSGSKHLVGKSAQAKSDMNCAFGTFCGLIRPTNLIDGRILGFFFQGPEYRKKISSMSLGVNINNLRREFIESLRFLLPPLNEQKRIVSKIEELLSKIDSTKQSLEHVKLQLEQYRYSFLKSVFEGKHTEKWEIKKLGDSDVSEIIMGQSPPGSTYNKEKNGMPFFQGIKDFGEKFPIATVWCTRPKKIAKKGDILLSVRAPVGTTNWAKEECCIGRGLVAIRPKIQSEYVYCFLKSIKIKLSVSGVGSVFNAISKGELCQISLPVPSLQEQEQIVSQIEQGFSLIENSQRIVNSTLQTLETMRMSVLKQAFQGKLVPQDPNDEPAEILLERIKKQKS